MKSFDELPKSIKKTLRYINQDVQSMETLEQIEKIIGNYIHRRKKQLNSRTEYSQCTQQSS